MLSPDAFEQWCWRLGLSDEAKAAITHILPSPPARHVQSSAGNMSGTYPSLTMGCGIQFESHRDELPFAYPIDHDSNVLEFYDQPAGEIKMNKSVPTSPEEWRQYWQEKGFPWRTEPEIDAKRQEELSQCRIIVPDIEKGIYPFKGMKLSRADVEWLLAAHQNGYGGR